MTTIKGEEKEFDIQFDDKYLFVNDHKNKMQAKLGFDVLYKSNQIVSSEIEPFSSIMTRKIIKASIKDESTEYKITDTDCNITFVCEALEVSVSMTISKSTFVLLDLTNEKKIDFIRDIDLTTLKLMISKFKSNQLKSQERHISLLTISSSMFEILTLDNIVNYLYSRNINIFIANLTNVLKLIGYNCMEVQDYSFFAKGIYLAPISKSLLRSYFGDDKTKKHHNIEKIIQHRDTGKCVFIFKMYNVPTNKFKVGLLKDKIEMRGILFLRKHFNYCLENDSSAISYIPSLAIDLCCDNKLFTDELMNNKYDKYRSSNFTVNMNRDDIYFHVSVEGNTFVLKYDGYRTMGVITNKPNKLQLKPAKLITTFKINNFKNLLIIPLNCDLHPPNFYPM